MYIWRVKRPDLTDLMTVWSVTNVDSNALNLYLGKKIASASQFEPLGLCLGSTLLSWISDIESATYPLWACHFKQVTCQLQGNLQSLWNFLQQQLRASWKELEIYLSQVWPAFWQNRHHRDFSLQSQVFGPFQPLCGMYANGDFARAWLRCLKSFGVNWHRIVFCPEEGFLFAMSWAASKIDCPSRDLELPLVNWGRMVSP